MLLRRLIDLHPLRGERRTPPSPAEFGEGSSGRGLSPTQAAWRHQNDSLPLSPLPFVIIPCTLETPSIPRPSPGTPMLARLLRLLVPLIPRRRPRTCSPPCVATGRRPASSARRRLHPTPSPRPRTQPLQRRPPVPSTAPTFVANPPEKSGPSYLSPARIPSKGIRAGER